MSSTNESTLQPEHQVIANGIVIYSGDDWQEAFLAAGMNPSYETVVHRVDGEKQAVLGPVQPSRHMPL